MTVFLAPIRNSGRARWIRSISTILFSAPCLRRGAEKKKEVFRGLRAPRLSCHHAPPKALSPLGTPLAGQGASLPAPSKRSGTPGSGRGQSPPHSQNMEKNQTLDRGKALHDAYLSLLVVPHLPLHVDLLQRPILLEDVKCLIDLSQQGLGIRVRLIEANKV